ncbi:MAG: hypothetical protein QM784_10710 [Polyangiaceae bacterium]
MLVGWHTEIAKLWTARENPCPAPECPSLVVRDHQPREVPSRIVKADPGRTPSLLQAFDGSKPKPFAGTGSQQVPTCQLSGSDVVATIPAGYSTFAGCFVETTTPMDLSAFQNGVVYVKLAHPAKQLEIKLEAGSDGDERLETYLQQAQAAAGEHTFQVKDVPSEILKHARRLTFAVNSDTGESNTITLRR